MTSELIMVNTVALDKSRNEVAEQLKLLETKMENMKTSVLALNKMWSGSANQAFNQAFSDDMEFLVLLCRELQKIVDYESNAIREYNKCEDRISDLIQEIKI